METSQALRRRPLLIGYFVFLAGIFKMVLAEVVEVCIAEDLKIRCPTSAVIAVTSAEFGRMEVGRCITEEDEFLGCTNDVLPLLDRWCSGRRECIVEVRNEDLEKANVNCMKILMKYLKVEYTCLKVEASCIPNKKNLLVQKDGYISSTILDQNGCGSIRSPWVISASPGQTIHLTMTDFTARSRGYSLTSCATVYGFILERSLRINQTICGGNSREVAIYESKTNSVEIYILAKKRRTAANFVVHYSALGCAEFVPPMHAWYKREGNKAFIGCDSTNKEWHLTCVDNKWVGDIGNCTEIITVVKDEDSLPANFHISSIVVISGIAGAAVVLSVIAVVCGVVYINKYRMKQEMKRANLYKTYSTIGSNMQAYYRPVTGDQSDNSAACWDMSLLANNQMTLLSDKCTCPTLQMRNTGEGDRTLERQSLYSSIRST